MESSRGISVKINIERLKEHIETLGKIGYIQGKGITREPFSKTYGQAEKYVTSLMKEAGLLVKKDALGNIYGRLEGQKEYPKVLVGSHIDTVPEGGKLDGALGVLGAIECLQILHENNITPEFPIEVIAFNAEEGGTSLGGTFGSKGITGKLDLENPFIMQEIQAVGVDVEKIKECRLDTNKVKCFIEMHIEQGGILDRLNIPIGIVTGIVHIHRYQASVKGEANHAGTTPMNIREDALMKAIKFIEEVNKLSIEKGEGFVGTVGKLDIIPGAINVIPGQVDFSIEFRSLDEDKLRKAEEEIYAFAQGMDRAEVRLHTKNPGVLLNQYIQNQIEKSCKELNYDYKYMQSGAGHDAATLGSMVPTGMIFIPSVGGISHSKEEYSSWEDIEKGSKVLLHTLMNLSKN